MKKSSRHNSYFILYQTVRRIYTKKCGIVPRLHIYSDLYNHSRFCIHILRVQHITLKLVAALSKMVPIAHLCSPSNPNYQVMVIFVVCQEPVLNNTLLGMQLS